MLSWLLIQYHSVTLLKNLKDEKKKTEVKR